LQPGKKKEEGKKENFCFDLPLYQKKNKQKEVLIFFFLLFFKNASPLKTQTLPSFTKCS
jgi:hypothetical protein